MSPTLDRAQAGDEQAFRELTDPYRHELWLHCYRMLGSLTDAEDLLQETLIAAWRGLRGFAGRASVRSWLYRIATNRCLNALRDAGRHTPPEPVPPFDPPEPTRRSEITWLQPYPDTLLAHVADTAPTPDARYDAKEAVQLAFVASLQHLPPRQAAVLLLRDVLDFRLNEVARMLEISDTAAKGMLQRARGTIDKHRTRHTVRPPAPGSPQEKELGQRFADALGSGDIDGVIALLTDRAWLAMPPAPHEYHGATAIADFLRTSAGWRRSEGRPELLVPTRANSQLAFGFYIGRPGEPIADVAGIVVLTLEADRIGGITRFLDSGLHQYFDLPETVPTGLPR